MSIHALLISVTYYYHILCCLDKPFQECLIDRAMDKNSACTETDLSLVGKTRPTE
jgi:hypothetical protein